MCIRDRHCTHSDDKLRDYFDAIIAKFKNDFYAMKDIWVLKMVFTDKSRIPDIAIMDQYETCLLYTSTVKIEADHTTGKGSVSLSGLGSYATFTVASYSAEFKRTSDNGLVEYKLQ